MKTLTSLLTALLLLSGALPSRADVTAFSVIVRSEDSYVVPTGKVLLLSGAVALGTDGDFKFRVYLNGAGEKEFFLAKAVDNSTEPLSIGRLYLPAGTRFEHRPAVTKRSFALVGRLADEGDLFAEVPTKLEPGADAGDHIQALARLASPRPARVETKESTDLETWTEGPTVVAQEKPGVHRLELAKNGAPQKFLQATGRARPDE